MQTKNQQIRYADHGKVPPLIDKNCNTLVLGSMLSPKSEQAAFYYAHPQNRFWRVLAAVFNDFDGNTTQSRKELALSHHVALWDVIKSCEIVGASDSTIKNVEYNDIVGLLTTHPKITRIFTTGTKAFNLLQAYNITAQHPIITATVSLPSTSPQNCKVKLDELIAAYSVLNK